MAVDGFILFKIISLTNIFGSPLILYIPKTDYVRTTAVRNPYCFRMIGVLRFL